MPRIWKPTGEVILRQRVSGRDVPKGHIKVKLRDPAGSVRWVTVTQESYRRNRDVLHRTGGNSGDPP